MLLPIQEKKKQLIIGFLFFFFFCVRQFSHTNFRWCSKNFDSLEEEWSLGYLN